MSICSCWRRHLKVTDTRPLAFPPGLLCLARFSRLCLHPARFFTTTSVSGAFFSTNSRFSQKYHAWTRFAGHGRIEPSSFDVVSVRPDVRTPCTLTDITLQSGIFQYISRREFSRSICFCFSVIIVVSEWFGLNVNQIILGNSGWESLTRLTLSPWNAIRL